MKRAGKKVIQCEACRAFISFRNKFNKFNNTRAQMLDSILSYDVKITFKPHFRCNNVISLSLCMQRCNGRHNVSRKSVNH